MSGQDEYHGSVGRGSNMLMGINADRRGLVPENDVAKLKVFGDAVKACYGKPVAATSEGKLLQHAGDFIELKLSSDQLIDRVWIREDLTAGQKAQEFRVLAQTQSGWTEVANGTSVGRKRIAVFANQVDALAVRVAVTKAHSWPLAVHEVAAFAPCRRPE